MRRALLLLTLTCSALPAQRAAFEEDLFREYDQYRGRLFDLVKAIPDDKLDWRPDSTARSVKEVVLHVALNNYMLLVRS